MPSYRNISFATADSVVEVYDQGSDVVVRDKATRELIGRLTTLEQPLERYLFLPKRRNNVFAQFAETMWMLAGRNDIAWLSRYLPRASDYSDDGQTWHGAYGPRLRRWAGDVDQIDKVRRLLSEDRASRRAVMVLFDPVRDFEDSPQRGHPQQRCHVGIFGRQRVRMEHPARGHGLLARTRDWQRNILCHFVPSV